MRNNNFTKKISFFMILITIGSNLTFAQCNKFMVKNSFHPNVKNTFDRLLNSSESRSEAFVSANLSSINYWHRVIENSEFTYLAENSFNEAKTFVLANAPKLNENISIKYSNDENDKKNNIDSEESFFTEELLYFVGAAALATTFYLVWSDDNSAVNKKTFGQPPKP